MPKTKTTGRGRSGGRKVTCQPCGLTGQPQGSTRAARALGAVHDSLHHRGKPTATTTR